MIELPDFNKHYFELLDSDEFKKAILDSPKTGEALLQAILDIKEESLEKDFGIKIQFSDRIKINTSFLLKTPKAYDVLAYLFIQYVDTLLSDLAKNNKITVSDYYYAHEMFYTWCKVIKKRGHLELDDIPYLKLMLSSNSDESKLLAIVSIKRLLVSTEDLRSAWRSHTRYSDSIDMFNKQSFVKRLWMSIKGIKHPD